tara:strand:- start:323 stop:517 length:195 start_codon:yes stop_codon:yes gene_type:complete
MAITYGMDGSMRKRKGNKIAIDLTPRNEKNLNKRIKMDPFTGGDQLDKIIEEQRKRKKNMKGKA